MKPIHIALPGALACMLLLSIIVLVSGCATPFAPKRQYVSQIVDHSRNTSNAVRSLQNLSAEPDLGNPVWEGEVRTQLGLLRRLVDEARHMPVPAEFQAAHTSYLAAIEPLDSLVGTFDRAVALNEGSEMQQARYVIEQGLVALQNLNFSRDEHSLGHTP